MKLVEWFTVQRLRRLPRETPTMLRRLLILWLVFFHLSAQAAGVGYACRMLGGQVVSHCHCPHSAGAKQHSMARIGQTLVVSDRPSEQAAPAALSCCEPVIVTLDTAAINDSGAGAAAASLVEWVTPLAVLLPPVATELASAAVDTAAPDWRQPALPITPLYLRTQRLRL